MTLMRLITIKYLNHLTALISIYIFIYIHVDKMSILTDIVGEVPLEAVEDEPALLPRLDLAAHLHQVALAHLLCEDDEGAGVHTVA